MQDTIEELLQPRYVIWFNIIVLAFVLAACRQGDYIDHLAIATEAEKRQCADQRLYGETAFRNCVRATHQAKEWSYR